MNVRELRWWSPTALAAVGAAVEPTWSRWCEAWGVAAAPVVAMNAFEVRLQADVCAMELLPCEEAWVGVDAPVRGDAVRGLLFGEIPPGLTRDESVTHEIAERAWADLRTRLAALLGDGHRATTSDAPAPPLSDFAEWSGAVVLRLVCSGAPACIALHLSEPRVARLCGHGGRQQARPTASMRPERRSVSEAIQDRHVALRVGLDDVLLDLATLGSLRCGDVVTLPHRLDQTLRVRVAAFDQDAVDHTLCAAVLGARGDRRAVELVHLP